MPANLAASCEFWNSLDQRLGVVSLWAPTLRVWAGVPGLPAQALFQAPTLSVHQCRFNRSVRKPLGEPFGVVLRIRARLIKLLDLVGTELYL